MKCTKCLRRLRDDAQSCMCGWSLNSTGTGYVLCGFDGCPTSATIRRKEPTGWINVCEAHDHELHMKDAKAYLLQNGLDRQPDETRDQWLVRMGVFRKKRMKNFGKPKASPQREPGEDHEEIADYAAQI